MRIPLHYSEQIQLARQESELTKTQVARATGIDRRRIQEYEDNKRRPTNSAIHKLSRFFQVNLRVNWNYRRYFGVKSIAKSHLLYHPRQERPFRVRLATARRKAPKLTASLESKICRREDLNSILDILVGIATDSYLELLVIMHLLADGGSAGYMSPGSQGYYGPQIIDPVSRHNVGAQRFPVIRWNDSLWFPQVSLKTTPTIRVDFLVCSKSKAGPVWSVVEVDGPGHRPDTSRQPLPFDVVRLQESDVQDENLTTALIAHRALRKTA